jgi:hypothetical protein
MANVGKPPFLLMVIQFTATVEPSDRGVLGSGDNNLTLLRLKPPLRITMGTEGVIVFEDKSI